MKERNSKLEYIIPFILSSEWYVIIESSRRKFDDIIMFQCIREACSKKNELIVESDDAYLYVLVKKKSISRKKLQDILEIKIDKHEDILISNKVDDSFSNLLYKILEGDKDERRYK